MRIPHVERDRVVHPVAAKVPLITALFWVVKVLTTGMGEAASDWLGEINLALAGVVGLGGIVIALRRQLRTDRYVAGVYWFAVAMVAVFGTMAADALHVVLALPYAVTTVLYAIAVAVVFWLWRRQEGTLSIHSITTRRREIFYWVTVLLTFALGTAAGDLTATSLNLGYLGSGLLFTGLIIVPALAWWRGWLGAVPAFWTAYVLTRPLGASFADWLGKPPSRTGLGWGDGVVTLLATVAIVALVTYFARTRTDVQPVEGAAPTPRPVSTPDADPGLDLLGGMSEILGHRQPETSDEGL